MHKQNNENGAELSPEELKERYKEARCMTAGRVFGKDNRHLGRKRGMKWFVETRGRRRKPQMKRKRQEGCSPGPPEGG